MLKKNFPKNQVGSVTPLRVSNKGSLIQFFGRNADPDGVLVEQGGHTEESRLAMTEFIKQHKSTARSIISD